MENKKNSNQLFIQKELRCEESLKKSAKKFKKFEKRRKEDEKKREEAWKAFLTQHEEKRKNVRNARKKEGLIAE